MSESQNGEEFQMPFGKYQGRCLIALLEDDPGYLDWMRDTNIPDRYPEIVRFLFAYAEQIDARIGE